MLETNFDDFLLPVENTISNDEMISGGVVRDSPSKRFGVLLSERNLVAPESPDMKFARNRLGNLLTSIKHGESISGSMDLGVVDIEERITGRQRRLEELEDKRVVFQLRGKPFCLTDGRTETCYALSRAWVRGETADNVYQENKHREYAPDLPTEVLATREITAMPMPDPQNHHIPLMPLIHRQSNEKINADNARELKNDHVRHWKRVKRSWCAHTRKREERFKRSEELLEAMFNC
ncbi:unnamed protein product [Caenorhabditis auriculariae]|uniref:Uncharacterized protein n=1 Tax=Caenorhabditis auriculariae TaxID=2777116 RepID=A0A8S1GYQ5_9PELO|nr:unnamed protein product [Caenorhabditis auriculariae]